MTAITLTTTAPRRPNLRVVSPTAPASAHLRLTRRGRMVVTVLALGLALAAGSVAQRAAAGTPDRAMEVTAHTVAAGETLWRIAAGITEPGEDVREAVDQLMELNGLADSALQVGQQLVVPTS